jgi:hypothetical protein
MFRFPLEPVVEMPLVYQIDVLESLPAAVPLILPSTTLSETRHRSLPLYNRLQSLLAEEDRKVWIFWNEERRETATKVERYRVGEESQPARIDDDEEMEGPEDVTQSEGSGKTVRETVNDRNDRGELGLRSLSTYIANSTNSLSSYSIDYRLLSRSSEIHLPSKVNLDSSLFGPLVR